MSELTESEMDAAISGKSELERELAPSGIYRRNREPGLIRCSQCAENTWHFFVRIQSNQNGWHDLYECRRCETTRIWG